MGFRGTKVAIDSSPSWVIEKIVNKVEQGVFEPIRRNFLRIIMLHGNGVSPGRSALKYQVSITYLHQHLHSGLKTNNSATNSSVVRSKSIQTERPTKIRMGNIAGDFLTVWTGVTGNQ